MTCLLYTSRCVYETGQAPSYQVGQRIWEQVRDAVKEPEGGAFDIKAFHKRALDVGGVGLDTLRSVFQVG